MLQLHTQKGEQYPLLNSDNYSEDKCDKEYKCTMENTLRSKGEQTWDYQLFVMDRYKVCLLAPHVFIVPRQRSMESKNTHGHRANTEEQVFSMFGCHHRDVQKADEATSNWAILQLSCDLARSV